MNVDLGVTELLPLSALRLLVSPVQLLSAALWKVAENGDVMDYGKLESLVTSVTEVVPELFSFKLKAQLIMGLRAKLVLEMCRTGQTMDPQALQTHLDRIRTKTLPPRKPESCEAELEASVSSFQELVQTLLADPVKKEYFFQEVFPVEYGPKYDSVLRELMWEFLSRLAELLPVPDLKQTACWLSAAPSVLDECVECIAHTQPWDTLLRHHQNLGHLKPNGTQSTPIGDRIFSSLSCVPLSGGAVKTSTISEIQSEFLNDSALYTEELETESIVVTEYAEVELATSIFTSEGFQLSTESRTEMLETENSQFELDQRGVQEEHLGKEVEFGKLYEEDEQLDRDIELVSMETDDISTSRNVVCEGVCEKLESVGGAVDGAVQVIFEEVNNNQSAKPEYDKSEINLENSEIQLSEGENLPEEHQVKEKRAEGSGEEEDESAPTAPPSTDPERVSSKCGSQIPGDPVTSRQCEHQRGSRVPPSADRSAAPVRVEKMTLRSRRASQGNERQVMVPKKEANGTRVTPVRLLPRPADDEQSAEDCGDPGLTSAVSDSSDGTVETPAVVFSCSQCSFYHTDELRLRQHVKERHPEKRNSLLTTELSCGIPEPETVPTAGECRLRKTRSKTCPVCGKTFSRATDMRRHQRSHTGERPHKCPQCAKTFLYSFDLKRHQRTGAGSRPFRCCMCRKGFDEEGDLKTHCSVEHTTDTSVNESGNLLSLQANMDGSTEEGLGKEGLHKCPICNLSFRQLSLMKQHQSTHSDNDSPRCKHCWKKYPNSEALARHMQMHNQERPFHCSVCKMNFTQFVCLRQHYLKSHNEEGSFRCSQCPKGFSRLSNLIKHQRTHSGERPYQCSHCPKRFTQLPILTRHERIHTGERPFLCPECGKSFLSSGELSKHLQCHSEERPFVCPQCDKTFKANRFLKKHLKTHTGERPFPCSFCGKQFAVSTDLTRHNRIHTGERPHLCSQCGKSFLTSAEVLKHQRYHTGERPFKCTQCGKTFTQSCYLTVHMRIHTGERPYGCTHCGKCFNSTTPLRRHMLTHTGEKPFVCSNCGKAFNRMHLLRTHEKSHTLS